DYCERDVATTTGLLRRLAPRLTLQALQRGRFTRTASRMLHDGPPCDDLTLNRIHQNRERILRDLIDDVNPAYGVFEGTTLKLERMEGLVRRYDLPWPRLESGCLSMDRRVWGRMSDRFPFLEPLHHVRRMTSLLRDNALAIGRDGRNRYKLFPFAAETGRN